jgi:hypothetical protein
MAAALLVRGSTESERRNVLICQAWTRTEMEPAEKGTDWKAINPALCLGGTPFMTRPDIEVEDELEEEYCVREGTEGKEAVREGPCVVRNSSGMVFEQGQYRNGKKDVEWTSASWTQVVVRVGGRTKWASNRRSCTASRAAPVA